jgi:hypothetical protein
MQLEAVLHEVQVGLQAILQTCLSTCLGIRQHLLSCLQWMCILLVVAAVISVSLWLGLELEQCLVSNLNLRTHGSGNMW